MMRRLAIIFVLLGLVWLGGAASSQTIEVRTGEHAEFTRVVLQLPDGTGWQLGRSDTGYVVRLSTPADFALDTFYDLIPRDRIAAVFPGPQTGELSLQVTCTCFATAFLYRNDFLVIDINDGPPSTLAAFEARLPDLASGRADARRGVGYQVPRNPLLPLIFEAPVAAADATAVPAFVETAEIPSPPPPPEPVPLPEVALDELSALEDAIIAGIGRGITEGLLDPARRLPVAAEGSAVDTAALVAQMPGIRAQTGLDPEAVPVLRPAPLTQTGAACLSDSFFALDRWADARPLTEQIAEARNGLYGEFDRPDAEAVLRLARLYLHFGFGAEARQVLALDGNNSQERAVLGQIGRIIDGDPADPALFAEQVSCEGPTALWALLVQPNPLDAQVNAAAVIRAFRLLPEPLADHLRPRLGDRFLAIGDIDSAAQVMDLGRLPSDDPGDAVLPEARLLEAVGEETAATARVTEVVRSDARIGAEAMIRFLEQAAEGRVAPTDDDFLTADSLRFEFAGTPQALTLARAQVRAYLALDRFEDAVALYDSAVAEADPALGDALYGAVAARLTDGPFLSFIWDRSPVITTPETQHALASRLIDLGFAARGQALLAAQSFPEAADDHAYLNARAALSLGAPDTALAWLATQSDDRAQALRAEAQAALARAGGDPLVRLDGLSTTNGLPVPAASGQREEERALLSGASSLREDLSTLLRDTEIPPDL